MYVCMYVCTYVRTYTCSLLALRVTVSPGGIAGNILLGEQVYVPLCEESVNG